MVQNDQIGTMPTLPLVHVRNVLRNVELINKWKRYSTTEKLAGMKVVLVAAGKNIKSVAFDYYSKG